MKKIVLCLPILCTLGTPLCAETLNDAFAKSYQNNPTLKSARAKLRALDENYAQAKSGWRPSVSLVGSLGYDKNELKLDGRKLSDDSRSPYSAAIVVDQPLFSGFNTIASEKSAENSIRAGRYELMSSEQSLLVNTVSAYSGVLYAEAALKLNQNKEQVYKEHVQESKEKYEVGEITVTDYAQSEAGYEGAKAERIAAEGALKNAKTYYEVVVGEQPNDLEEITIPVSLIPTTIDDVLSKALVDNPTIKSAYYVERSARNDVAVAGSSLLPSLNAEASATMGKNQQYDDDNYKDFKATATLRVPLYEAGLSYSKVRQAKETANERRMDIESSRLNIRNSVYESWENLNAVKAKIVAYQSQIKAYKIAVDSTTKEWEVGTKTMVDVMDAEQDLLDAELNEIEAKRQEVVESFNLISLIGGLTVENMNINTTIYNPVKNYDKVKGKWIGTGNTED